MQKISLHKQRDIWNKWLYRFSFFMAFPVIIVITNISFYIFIQLLYISPSKFSIKKPLSFFALLFAIGAAISVIFAPDHPTHAYLIRSLSSLPNYLYWAFLIIFFIHHRNKINVPMVQKALFYGLFFFIPFHIIRDSNALKFFFIQKTTLNMVSFVLICFTPSSIYYVLKKKGKFYAYTLFLIILAFLLSEGRRSGFMLVGLGGVGVLFIKSFSLRQGLITFIIGVVLVFVINTPQVETFFRFSNERIYNLIYENENIVTEDRSYLMRRLMVEKALTIFKEHPVTGIGIINFSYFEVIFTGDFEGSQYVLHKLDLNKVSSHNSYATILAEGGLVMFIPFILILGSLLLYFLTSYNKIREEYRPFFWGLIGTVFHFYFIAAIVNVYAWFLIAMCAAMRYRSQPSPKQDNANLSRANSEPVLLTKGV